MGAPEGLTLRVMVPSSQELAALPDIATSARGRTQSHHRFLSPFLLDPMFVPLCMDPLDSVRIQNTNPLPSLGGC